jgi:enoyl-[acyl-carrier protein] reductase I
MSIEKKSDLLKGKKALIMGVANEKSIAWGIAHELRAHGAELAFTYMGEQIMKRLEPLAKEAGSDIMIECNVSSEDSLDKAFAELKEHWPEFDMLVHAIAYSDKEELKGMYVDTTLENFLNTMHVSCYSFTSVMRRAKDMMPVGGSAITLSYYGAQKVMPFYNVMGVAKAALEASTRYLAADLGPKYGIRVNAVSAGPMRTLAGSAIGGARATYKHNIETAPLRRAVMLEELGGTAVYLLSDMGGAVTGETHFVDCGFNVVGMKKREEETEAS